MSDIKFETKNSVSLQSKIASSKSLSHIKNSHYSLIPYVFLNHGDIVTTNVRFPGHSMIVIGESYFYLNDEGKFIMYIHVSHSSTGHNNIVESVIFDDETEYSVIKWKGDSDIAKIVSIVARVIGKIGVRFPSLFSLMSCGFISCEMKIDSKTELTPFFFNIDDIYCIYIKKIKPHIERLLILEDEINVSSKNGNLDQKEYTLIEKLKSKRDSEIMEIVKLLTIDEIASIGKKCCSQYVIWIWQLVLFDINPKLLAEALPFNSKYCTPTELMTKMSKIARYWQIETYKPSSEKINVPISKS